MRDRRLPVTLRPDVDCTVEVTASGAVRLEGEDMGTIFVHPSRICRAFIDSALNNLREGINQKSELWNRLQEQWGALFSCYENPALLPHLEELMRHATLVWQPDTGVLEVLPPEELFWLARGLRTYVILQHLKPGVPLSVEEVEERLRRLDIAVAGGSVGYWVALALTLAGVRQLRIADKDVYDATNTSRVPVPTAAVGERKTDQLAYDLLRQNPFLRLTRFGEGLTRENLDLFLAGATDVVDLIDDIGMKLLLRESARENRLRYWIVTDIGFACEPEVRNFANDPSLPLTLEISDTHLRSEIEHWTVTPKEERTVEQFTRTASALIGDWQFTEVSEFADAIRDTSTFIRISQFGPTAMMAGGALANLIIAAAFGLRVPERTLLDPIRGRMLVAGAWK